MRMTALGRIIVIHPCFDGSGQWCVVQADKNGNWKSASIHNSESEAATKRSELFALHRKLRRERGDGTKTA